MIKEITKPECVDKVLAGHHSQLFICPVIGAVLYQGSKHLFNENLAKALKKVEIICDLTITNLPPAFLPLSVIWDSKIGDHHHDYHQHHP